MSFEAFKFRQKPRPIQKVKLRTIVRDSSIPIAEGGLEGSVSFVKAFIAKDVKEKRPIRLVKKEYHSIRRDLLDSSRTIEVDAKRSATRDASFLKRLQSIGCKTVPTVRFLVDKSTGKPHYYLLQTDLGFSGKKRVLVEPSNSLNKIEKMVTNFDEVLAQIRSDIRRANEAGLFLYYDAWLVQIDPQTKKGTAFLSDVGASRIYSEELIKDPHFLKMEGLPNLKQNYQFLQRYWRLTGMKKKP